MVLSKVLGAQLGWQIGLYSETLEDWPSMRDGESPTAAEISSARRSRRRPERKVARDHAQLEHAKPGQGQGDQHQTPAAGLRR
jgi:hypothetical protein